MIQIRRTTYHGRPGFLVCGRVGRPCTDPKHINPRCTYPEGWLARVAIFTRTRAVAERIRDKLKADPSSDINTQDFDEGDGA